MGDQRNLTFGIQWAVDTAPLDEIEQKEREAQEQAQRTGDALEQIGANLQGIGARASAAFNGVSGASTSMGTSIRSAIQASIQQGNNLGKTLKSGIGAALDNVQAKAKAFGAGAKSIFNDMKNAVMHPAQTIKATLGVALDSAGKSTKGLGEQSQNAGNDIENMGRKGGSAADSLSNKFASLVKTIAGLAIIKKVAGYIKDFTGAAINAAADAEETQSKFETVFGDQTAGAMAWVENFANAAKRSKEEVKGFMADSQAMMKGLGMTEEAGAVMSEQMTALAYDLASFHNIADQAAFDKIRSGLMGEMEGLKSMGIVMNEAAIQQSMLEMGWKGNTSELRKQFNALDEGTKAQIRFNTILSQSADAQQDVTRTAGSYTNSLKGVKGMWQDFLANAGAKFTPVLTSLFNKIIELWPTIEPMLMQFVDVLAQGFAQAVPVLLELGQTLLPILSSALSVVFTVLQPLIPVFNMFAQTVLPPLASILALLAQTLLPPITQILNVICTSILQPMMPILQVIAQAILPPLAQLLGVIAPILQAIAPVLQVIGTILEIVANVIGTIIGWVSDGIGAVVDFFGSIFGGAKEAAGATDELADSMADMTDQVGTQTPSMADIQMPEISMDPVEIPPVQLNTIPAQQSMQDVGISSGEMYQSITEQSSSAWDEMGSAAKAGADGIILQFRRIRDTAAEIGTVSIKATVSGAGVNIPKYASGTDDHPGGWAEINDGPSGGELAYLPGGSAVVPADKTDRIISRSGGKTTVFAPNIAITMPAGTSDAEKQAMEARLRQVIQKEYERIRRQEAAEEAIQEGIA